MTSLLIQGDCLEKLHCVADASIQTIIIEPPYNIGKDGWDVIPDYNEWMVSVIELLVTKLKSNGSFFMFHNDIPILSRLIVSIGERIKSLKFRQMIF